MPAGCYSRGPFEPLEPMMQDKEFQKFADAALARIADALVDYEELGLDTTHDTVKIEFSDATKLIVNRHTAARQIWLAAPSGAWHFACDDTGQKWLDVRTGTEMYGQLSTLIHDKLGKQIDF